MNDFVWPAVQYIQHKGHSTCNEYNKINRKQIRDVVFVDLRLWAVDGVGVVSEARFEPVSD